MTRLWAVCHVDNSITFASALLDQSEEFQDLVIVHELVHLLFRDHGEHFHTLVRVFVPDGYRIARLAPESPAEWMQSRGVRDARGVYRTSAEIGRIEMARSHHISRPRGAMPRGMLMPCLTLPHRAVLLQSRPNQKE